jgi:putative tetraheme cytochrome c
VIDSNKISAQAQKMYAHYKKLLGSDKELKCISYLYMMQDIALALEITLNTESQHIKFMRRRC